MIKIKVNDRHEFEVVNKENKVWVNGEEFQPDLVQISPTRYHLLLGNKSYNLSIVDSAEGKHFTVDVNGSQYKLDVKDRFDILLDDLGLDMSAGNKVDNIKAPMPGLVLDILVSVGEVVEKDTPLIVLEAMKMENVIKAPGAGTVEKVLVKAKDAVEKGQVLITFA